VCFLLSKPWTSDGDEWVVMTSALMLSAVWFCLILEACDSAAECGRCRVSSSVCVVSVFARSAEESSRI
jgi:hypothetical protein